MKTIINDSPINCQYPVIVMHPHWQRYVELGFNKITFNGKQVDEIPHDLKITPKYYPFSHYQKIDKAPKDYPNQLKKLKHYEFIDGEYKLVKEFKRKYYNRIHKEHLDADKAEQYQLLNQNTGELIPLYIVVRCNHCILCRRYKQFRYKTMAQLESLSHVLPPLFITLTYNNEHLPKDTSVKYQVREMQNFNKRLRKRLSQIDTSISYKYIFVSEFGEKNNRLHYHALIYGIPEELRKMIPNKTLDNGTKKHRPDLNEVMIITDLIYDSWNKGYTMTEIAQDSTGSYVMKYIGKREGTDTKMLKSIKLGHQLIDKKLDELRANPEIQTINYLDNNSKLQKLPLYDFVKNKVFPSLSRQLEKDFRDALYDLVRVRNSEHADVPALNAKLKQIYRYQDLIDLLDYNDAPPTLTKMYDIDKVIYIDRVLKYLDSFNYDIVEIMYIDRQRQTNIIYSNMQRYDVAFNAYQEDVRMQKIFESETDNQ